MIIKNIIIKLIFRELQFGGVEINNLDNFK